MLNWGASLPASLTGSHRPGRPPDPRRPAGRLSDGHSAEVGSFDGRTDALVMAEWTRGEGIRRLSSGERRCGLLRLAPGSGKAS